MKHQVKARTSHIQDAQFHIELYYSLADIAVHYAEVNRCMCTTIDPTTAIIHCIAQTSQAEAISAARQIMDHKLTHGPMAKALQDLLPYCDQHDPSCIPKANLHLARIQDDPVPFHPGHSIICQEANENILVERRPASAGIQQYLHQTDEVMIDKEKRNGMGTPNTYSTDPDPPTLSTFSDGINVYKQLIALSIVTEDNVPQDQIHRKNHNASISSTTLLPPLEIPGDAQTVDATELNTLSPDEALPLPIPLNIPPKRVIFYELGEPCIIGEGPEPWRLIWHDIGRDKVLVHAKDFPAEFTHTRLKQVLRAELPTITEIQLQHMHLHLENTIALYQNVKCTCISKTHSTFYNKAYSWVIDLNTQDMIKWEALHKHSLYETIDRSVMLLKKSQDNPQWGNHYVSNYEALERLLAIRCIAKDLNKQNPLAAVYKDAMWLIRTSQGEQVIIEEKAEEFNDLICSLHSNSPLKRLGQLQKLLDEPVNIELEQ